VKTAVKYDVPFVPSSEDSVSKMVKLANITQDDKAIDLGAGDGRLVVALANAGAITVGVEIDKERQKLANRMIAAHGLVHRARVIRGSFWQHDLSIYDIIALYGLPSIMERLKRKILVEARVSVRVISNHFEFPGWIPTRTDDNIRMYKPFN
jgi:16S rRNA A1518/A1519 N6-dimethyltransferase RsmA/KsgA/DIM1 with predicted DNA glycosylase/AP lyase activity